MGHAAMNIYSYFPLLGQGMIVTCKAWVLSTAISFLIGTILAILSYPKIASPSLIFFINIYTFLARGIPAYVHILIAYFVIPLFFGITIPGFVAAIGALAFCSGGYVTEIIRSGMDSLPEGQWDASFVLGYSNKQAMLRVILPQAYKNILPALLGECVQLLKSTSLLATIGITELTRAGMNIISRELNPLPVYFFIAGMYLFFSAIMRMVTKKVILYG